MTSNETFTHVEAPSSIGHGSLQTSPLGPSSSRAPNAQGVTYVRVGRGIVPTTRYEKSAARGRSNADEFATSSMYSPDGETSPGGSTKPKWYKQPFIRGRNMSLQGILSGRSSTSTVSNKSPIIHQEAELPIIDVAPPPPVDRGAQNEAGPSKLRKPRSQSPLTPTYTPPSPTHPITRTRRIPSSTLPLRSVQSMFLQHPNTRAHNVTEDDEDGQLLLDLLGVTERPLTHLREPEQSQLQHIPTSEPELEPEPEPEQRLTPPPVRRLPIPPQFPAPVLNIPPPHDSQDAFAYVFGPTPRSSFVDPRGSIPPPPYVQRQSAVLDRYMNPTRNQSPSDHKTGDLPPVAPLSIRRRDRD
ncbi:hypothetical protein RHS04_05579 [Rhizoctonia solani]|uniref:Uncharacterized protein n=1 Tax=Rhizoctonia solani TaxID=456999 RepID=A0A8H7H7N0_9AGAM|nr:hypothetical protein RHS04_05579 [Rhizoctonia solani]